MSHLRMYAHAKPSKTNVSNQTQRKQNCDNERKYNDTATLRCTTRENEYTSGKWYIIFSRGFEM